MKLGYGTWGFSGKEYGHVSEAYCEKLLNYSYKKRVRFFDTSPSYGCGRAERIIGNFLSNVDRKKIIICTKCGMLPHKGFKMKQDFSIDNINKSIKESLKNLRVEYLDILLLHSPNIKKINLSKIFKLIKKLKKNKLIKDFGISLRNPNDIFLINNLKEIDYLEFNFNILDQRAIKYKLFSLLKKFKIKAICRTPLAFGFLTDNKIIKSDLQTNDHRKKWSNNQFNAWNNFKYLYFLFQKKYKEKNLSDFALRFCNSFNFDFIIPGMMNLNEINKNIKVFKRKKINTADLAKIFQLYKKNEKNMFVQKRSR
jgi:aryl-alcohol dehydrogenase-like predicted oxidoreductase